VRSWACQRPICDQLDNLSAALPVDGRVLWYDVSSKESCLKKFFLFLVPALLFSQETPFRSRLYTIQAVGEATVEAAPDQAQRS